MNMAIYKSGHYNFPRSIDLDFSLVLFCYFIALSYFCYFVSFYDQGSILDYPPLFI